MLLIVSQKIEPTTDAVIEWLLHYKIPFIRINGEDSSKLINVTITDNTIEVIIESNGIEISSKDITHFWYRRGAVVISDFQVKKTFQSPLQELNVHLNEEKQYFMSFFYDLIEKNAKCLNSYFGTVSNKLMSLHYAQKLGIKIPNTTITTKKEQIIDFNNVNKEIITKSIQDIAFVNYAKGVFFNYTEFFNTSEIEKTGDVFWPTLFQKKISKKYELRIFFIEEKFYPMAIFSQKNEKTAVDFRKYDFSNPNRTVPYNLPTQLVSKLRKLMGTLKLNCGSIDMIVDENNDYIFLEVNPVGQFGMTSGPCNYYLEKEVASFFNS